MCINRVNNPCLSRFGSMRRNEVVATHENWCDECLSWIDKGAGMMRTRVRAPDGIWDVRHFHLKCWEVHCKKCSECEVSRLIVSGELSRSERWFRCRKCLDACVNAV